MVFVCYHVNFKCHIFEVHRLVKLYKASVVREILRTNSLGDQEYLTTSPPHNSHRTYYSHSAYNTAKSGANLFEKSHFLLPVGVK